MPAEHGVTWHYLEHWARTRPGAEAFATGATRLDYQEFHERVERAGRAFLAAGVRRGRIVALVAPARAEWPVICLAAHRIGAVWLGLSPKFTLDELSFMIGDSRPAVLVVVREFHGRDLAPTITALAGAYPDTTVITLGEPVPGTESWEHFAAPRRTEWAGALATRAGQARPDDDAVLLYTSGSTGRPKGVVHSHRSLLASLAVQIERLGFDEHHRALAHLPINHVGAAIELMLGTVVCGGFAWLEERFDPVTALEAIERERLTFLVQVPTMYLMMIRTEAFARADLSSLRTVVLTGAATPPVVYETLAALCARTGARLLCGWGMTETAGFVTYSEPGDGPERIMDSAGRAPPPFELRVVDEARRPLPDGEIGEIAVRGGFLLKRYVNLEAATTAAFDGEGWFHTGDLAWRDGDGYIHLTGRKSEMFKSGGENVFPREIETVLESHDAVALAAVIGVPDELYGEVGWAYVMPKAGHTVSSEALEALCREQLANFKVPKRIFVREELPMLGIGKVDKPGLRERVLAKEAS